MNKDFGWVNVKDLYLNNEDGLGYYEGIFRKDSYKTTITKAIRFWCKHPKKAMSYIFMKSNNIEDVEQFNEKSIKEFQMKMNLEKF